MDTLLANDTCEVDNVLRKTNDEIVKTLYGKNIIEGRCSEFGFDCDRCKKDLELKIKEEQK